MISHERAPPAQSTPARGSAGAALTSPRCSRATRVPVVPALPGAPWVLPRPPGACPGSGRVKPIVETITITHSLCPTWVGRCWRSLRPWQREQGEHRLRRRWQETPPSSQPAQPRLHPLPGQGLEQTAPLSPLCCEPITVKTSLYPLWIVAADLPPATTTMQVGEELFRVGVWLPAH